MGDLVCNNLVLDYTKYVEFDSGSEHSSADEKELIYDPEEIIKEVST